MKYRFDEIAINSTKKKKPEDSDKTHYIGLEHLDPQNLFVTRYGSEVAPIGEKLLMKKGDVLFGKRRAYQKKVSIAPFDGIFSAHGMVLRPNEEIVNKDYFPFFISSDYFLNEAIRISVGSLSPTINWRDLRKLEFSLPPLEEQEQLAKVLWAAYELKESYKKLIDATDEMVKGQFIEMFGYIYDDNGTPFNKLFIDDTKSAYKIPSSNYLENGTYPIFDQGQKYIGGYYNNHEGLCTKYPVIIFGDHTRDLKFVDKPFFIGADGVKVIRVKVENLHLTFSYYMLKYSYIPNTGYNRHFKWLKLKKFKVPPLKQQDVFLLLAQQAEQSKTQLQLSIKKIENVMKSLLP